MPDASEASTSTLPGPSISSRNSTATTSDAACGAELPSRQGAWWHDAVAGFTGGAAGILAANPLDLLKVREQVASTSGTVPAPRSKASTSKLSAINCPKSEGIVRGLHTLYRTEGWRVFFAGSFGPVVSYSIIDAFYFSIWGQTMELRHQDREDPSSLWSSFLAGGAAGTACAILQTPIEVIKVRAQIEREVLALLPRLPSDDAKNAQAAGKTRMGSVRITQVMMRKEGPRGFFVGFWPTLLRDGLANGIFFPVYHASRRLLRGEHPMLTRAQAAEKAARGESSIFRVAEAGEGQKLTGSEVGRIGIAGGLAGALSMILTYPLDVIKTQAQQLVKASAAGERAETSLRGIAVNVWSDGRLDAERRDPRFAQRNPLTRTLRSARGFGRGFKLGIATAALQSALILPVFELLGAVLGGR